MYTYRWLFIVLTIFISAVAGCGDSAISVDNSEYKENAVNNLEERSEDALVIHDFAGRQIDLPTAPTNIVALSNGDVDIIYALGGEVVGRPTSSSEIHVDAANEVEQIGTVHEIDLEKMTYVKPDVVLGNNPMSTKDIPIIESLGAQMVLTSANSIQEIKEQIQLYGQLLQKEEAAAALIIAIDEKLAGLEKQRAGRTPKVLLVYGAPGTYMAALPTSLSGDILEKAGGINIAADFPGLENYPQYAQLNGERIIEADPEYILLITHGNSESVKEGFIKEMKQNGAWNNLDAVINDRIEILPSDLFGSNPGTRVTEALDFLHDLLETAE
ncbi:iron complex transport system substrate-binding protein [Evansella caseinilytica]|uniref:Iron complex transport system substrate-binding protein n=1 Tax=Evansella caseinilytica TaxID=1503961 RepID=A0A1H3RDU4_9BACI|nr:iron complex transport system substrate-binding protein [Evansella caseinilytica]